MNEETQVYFYNESHCSYCNPRAHSVLEITTMSGLFGQVALVSGCFKLLADVINLLRVLMLASQSSFQATELYEALQLGLRVYLLLVMTHSHLTHRVTYTQTYRGHSPFSIVPLGV